MACMLSSQTPSNGCLTVMADEANTFMAGFGITADDKVWSFDTCIVLSVAINKLIHTDLSRTPPRKLGCFERSYLERSLTKHLRPSVSWFGSDETFKTHAWNEVVEW